MARHHVTHATPALPALPAPPCLYRLCTADNACTAHPACTSHATLPAPPAPPTHYHRAARPSLRAPRLGRPQAPHQVQRGGSGDQGLRALRAHGRRRGTQWQYSELRTDTPRTSCYLTTYYLQLTTYCYLRRGQVRAPRRHIVRGQGHHWPALARASRRLGSARGSMST